MRANPSRLPSHRRTTDLWGGFIQPGRCASRPITMTRLLALLAALTLAASGTEVGAQDVRPVEDAPKEAISKEAVTKEAVTKDAIPEGVIPKDTAAQEKSAPPFGSEPLKATTPARKPYLSEATAPDTIAILPPPPRGRSAAEAADRAAYTQTRILKGSPRWDLATNDVADGASAILDDFSCVLGMRLDQSKVPALMNLLERARLDISRATRRPKEHYRRLRPFIGNDAEICVRRTSELADNFSYPSGHTTQGWTYALIMASLVPGKATQLLARGRIYGDSRVVCGVHWLSDVQAGRMNGSAVFAALQGDPTFRADLERARADVTRALAGSGPAPDQAACAREEAGAKEPVF